MRHLALLLAAAASPAQDAPKLAEAYAAAVESVNERHAKKPAKTTEEELGKQLPAAARQSLTQLLAAKNAPALAAPLLTAAKAAADLALAEDFVKITAKLAQVDAKAAVDAGVMVARPRFLVIGAGGLDKEYLTRFADVVDAILTTYDRLFGFREYSKVPGKKLRFRVHLVPKIERPPHFAPEFPYHSEVDFPVANASGLTSPTPDGKFLFYGLCHELGHVVAMWGNRSTEEDHHTWAHYTGVAVVETLTNDPQYAPLVKNLTDARWRALSKEREAVKGAPSAKDRDGCMALWIALHDAVGPAAIGAAINALDAKDARLRVNRVRYYTFAELKGALVDAAKDEKAKKRVKELLP